MQNERSTLVEHNFRDIFYNSPIAKLIIGIDAPAYTILDANNAYLLATHSKREDLVGKSVFAAFPENPTDQISKNIERTIFSFEEAIRSKMPHTMSNYRYDIPIPGSDAFEERYWTTINTPVLDEKGNTHYFIHSPTNVTENVKLAEREKIYLEALNKQRQQLYATFMQAPVGIAIFKGPEYVVELINPPMCALYGQTMENMMGKPVFDVLTHSRDIGFEGLLDHVRNTGESYRGMEIPIPLVRKNKLETVYIDFVYEPLRENEGSISGVIAVATELTEQVNARHLLEDAEERARLAADAVGLGTFDLNLVSGEMITSDRFNVIFGFDKHVPRAEFVSVIHPDDAALRAQAHQDALVKGYLFYEVRVIWKDGSVHWIRVEGRVYYGAKKEALRILGTLLDVTEQKRDKIEQLKLVTLVNNSVDLMSILNMDGTNSYINEAGRQLLGFESEEQVRTTPISQLHAEADFELVQREVLPGVLDWGRWSGRMMVRHLQSGEIFPVFNNCIRIDDPVSGDPIAVGAVMRDLRPELAAKQALADSEKLFRSITTAAPISLWMSDANGDISYVNQTWIDWTGTDYEQNLGSGWLNAIVPDDRKKVANKFINDTNAHSLYEVEFRIMHASGKIHWCIATGQPQYLDDGTFSGYIGACSDITEQKNLQQQKDDFIGIASHELKTPVTSIKAYAQVLEKIMLKKGNDMEAGMMAKMDGQVNRLISLIGDLLDVTKINSGKLQFNDREFDFNELVAELVENLQHTTTKHRLIEHYGKTGVVFADKDRIGQVITNLITNAIKYSPHADKIIIQTELKDEEVHVCVEDFGIGIPGDKLDNVFEQFYRVSGDMQYTFPGLGLGLYISSEIIKREGGKIWVNSIEGKGSTFCFSLPVHRI